MDDLTKARLLSKIGFALGVIAFALSIIAMILAFMSC